MQLKKISQQTTELIRQAVWNVKQAHEQFVSVYKAAFADCCGQSWEADWRTWQDFEQIVDEVEEQIKAVCLGSGMPKSCWTKYRQGCRNVVWFAVPFKFRSVSTSTILKARELADQDQDGTQEQRVLRALKQLREEQSTVYAANAARKGGCHLLRLPKEDEDPDEFAKVALDTLRSWLTNDKVQQVIRSRRIFDDLTVVIQTALDPKPKKKGRKAG